MCKKNVADAEERYTKFREIFTLPKNVYTAHDSEVANIKVKIAVLRMKTASSINI